jgi:recombination protein RecT
MSQALAKIEQYTQDARTVERMEGILKDNAGAFLASVVSAVKGNNQLQKCDPGSVMKSAFVAAALKLPVDPNLGFSYIVPYKSSAQLQIGWKGFVQLAIRSGQYKNIHVAEVYSDELDYYNPITGEIKFTDLKTWDQRYKAGSTPCGYYARIELVSGFVKESFMTDREMNIHAEKFSMSYKYDLKNRKNSSVWSTDFSSMAKKTILKMLLSKFGILSTDMQTAVVKDQTGDGEYIDNKNVETEIQDNANQGEIIDIPATPEPEPAPKKESKETPKKSTKQASLEEEAGF